MRATVLFATLALPLVACCGCEWFGDSKGANGSSQARSSLEQCTNELAEIRAVYATIPDNLRQDDGGEVPVAKRVERCTALLESWSKRCDPASVEGGSETYYMLGRLLLANYDNYLVQLKSDTNAPKGKNLDRLAYAYLDRVIKHCQLAIEGSKPEQEWFVEALDLESDVHLRKHEYGQALALYQRVIKEFSDYREVHKSTIGASRCLFMLRRPDEALALLEAALDAESNEFRRLTFMRARWKPLLMTGEFQRVADYLEEMEHFCRTNMEREDISDDERLGFMKHLAEIGYHRTIFVLFPQGKFDAALSEIRKYKKEIPVLQARAKKINKNLASLNTYEFLSGLVEATLEKLAGKRVPLGLDQVIWAGDRKVTVKEPNDKVIAMVFHSNVKKGENTAKFIQALDHFARDNQDKLELCWFSRQASNDPRQELHDLKEAGGRLQLTHTALGVDSDFQKHTLFKRFHAPLLSGSLVIVDKSGRVVFQYLDPRWLHIGLSINTIRQYF